jgi:Protein of unknown function (DUF1572)
VALEFTTSYLQDAISLFRYYKGLGDRAIAQAPDASLAATVDRESNSIATIVKHLSGNMVSRWTDFLTSDGEKPSRNRDAEFEAPPQTRAEVLALWESGWKCAFDTLAVLTDENLAQTVYIRTEPHSVMQAITRQLGHCSYHVGQIVFLAKHFAGDKWTTLSVPRGRSADFNARAAKREVSQR